MTCTENKLRLVYGDVTLGIHGKGFSYLFSYKTGGMESMNIAGKEWLYRTPKPTFWRATTDNDRGNEFSVKSAMWLGADLFSACISCVVAVDGEELPLPIAPANNVYTGEEQAEEVLLTFCYRTATIPTTDVQVSYKVRGTGEIAVSVHYTGKKGLPELPVMGMRFIMPTKADGYCYEGLSGETYPDRKAGGVQGIYEVKGLPVTKYLVPQECGMHMDTKWVRVYRKTVLDNTGKNQEETALTFRAETEAFSFSCLPYTAEELENATHQEELPPARRTVLCVCGAVRGLGGIDSWGSETEPEYHIDGEKDIQYQFRICPGE